MKLKSFLWAASLHAVVYGVFVSMRLETPRSKSAPVLEVKLLPAEGMALSDGGRGGRPVGRSRRVGGQARRSDVAALKRFFGPDPWESEKPSGHTQVGESVAASADVGLDYGGGERGEALGKITVVSPIRGLAVALDRKLRFEKRLYQEHEKGTVSCRFKVGADGRLDARFVKAAGAERFLVVHLLRTLEELFESSEGPGLIEDAWRGREIFIVAHFVAKRGRSTEDPFPKVQRGRIEIERRRYLPAKLKIGPAEIWAINGEKEKPRLALGLPIEMESWFSASHRKRYGWSGSKRIDSEEAVWREAYDRLYDQYVSRGWIELGAS